MKATKQNIIKYNNIIKSTCFKMHKDKTGHIYEEEAIKILGKDNYMRGRFEVSVNKRNIKIKTLNEKESITFLTCK